MKALNPLDKSHDWGKDLIKDLSYIKKRKRYPFNKNTLSTGTIITFLIIISGRILFPVVFGAASSSNNAHIVATCFSIFIIVLILLQYNRVLSFDEVGSPYSKEDNIKLLKKFFINQQLSFTQHDQTVEVFLILSRDLTPNSKKEFREVMVFIADDKRILVNSHFVGNRFSITPPSGNYRKMGAKLHKWLNTEIENSNTQSLTVN